MLLKSFYSLEFNTTILDEFPLSKSFADLKNSVCLCVGRCGARPRLLRTGNKFQVKYGFHAAKRAGTVKTTSQGSHQNKNIVEKKRKMGVQPNNRPSSLLGNTGKSTNFSFIVLGSWFEFCPKIDISVKKEY